MVLAAQSLFRWSLVVASNDEEVLTNTLLASPVVDKTCEVIVKRGFSCAGEAYNRGLEEASSEVVVFAHQDVYLPATWVAELYRSIEYLSRYDPAWGVLGVFGVIHNSNSRTGYCYSTGLGRVLGRRITEPIPADSLDELVLVMRKSAGLRFDDQLPGFHLYGTDICLQAKQAGLNSYIVQAFCVHNSIGVRYLSVAFWRAYLYMRSKWIAQLPIVTCCSRITRSGWPILYHILTRTRDHLTMSVRVGRRTTDPAGLYNRVCQDLRNNLEVAR